MEVVYKILTTVCWHTKKLKVCTKIYMVVTYTERTRTTCDEEAIGGSFSPCFFFFDDWVHLHVHQLLVVQADFVLAAL